MLKIRVLNLGHRKLHGHWNSNVPNVSRRTDLNAAAKLHYYHPVIKLCITQNALQILICHPVTRKRVMKFDTKMMR